ncbi:armadillo-type protein [Mycena capillaripes]|nr:armadillo-type protein [Mycena capillaripes]
MPLLSRQSSRTSLLSWWSDRNPGLPGPTINIHSLAKPLMKWMYDRQALDMIGDNRGTLLSREQLEIYASYLLSDLVGWATKAAIFTDLAHRSLIHEMEARAVINSAVFGYLAQMLGSPNAGARRCSCDLLTSLVAHQSTRTTILELNHCVRLVSLSQDQDSTVSSTAMWVLSRIVQWPDGARAVIDLLSDKSPTAVLGAIDALSHIANKPDGAQAIVDANGLDHILNLLRSDSPDVREWSCILVARLAQHKFIAPAICAQVVTLLSDEIPAIVRNSMDALRGIANEPDGAHAIVDAKVFDHILKSLEAKSPDARQWACQIVARMAEHESITPAICAVLVAHFSDADLTYDRDFRDALSKVAKTADGAQAIVNVKGLDHMLNLLESDSPEVRERACDLVARLAEHRFLAPAICVRLVALLSDESRTIDVLSKIAQKPDGAQAVVDAKALDHVHKLLKSPNWNMRFWTCVLVEALAEHESTASAILALNLNAQLESLARDEDYPVTPAASHALTQIARYSNRAKDPAYFTEPGRSGAKGL